LEVVKKKEKKPKVDSVKEVHKILSEANRKISLPEGMTLEKEDEPFFESIIREFPKIEWSDHRVRLAVALAKAQSDMEQETNLLRKEGAVIETEKGWPVANPRKQAVQMNAGIILSLRRSLALHAQARARGSDIAQRNKKAKEIEDFAKNIDDVMLPSNIN
jgi:hypothetical protein